MTTYQTSEVAAIVGIHPNTVRLYEKSELLPKPERNGYRVFTDFHVEQCRLIRIAFQVERLQNGLRKKIVSMLKASAQGAFDVALLRIDESLNQLGRERRNAEEAIEIVTRRLSCEQPPRGMRGGCSYFVPHAIRIRQNAAFIKKNRPCGNPQGRFLIR